MLMTLRTVSSDTNYGEQDSCSDQQEMTIFCSIPLFVSCFNPYYSIYYIHISLFITNQTETKKYEHISFLFNAMRCCPSTHFM